MKFIALNVIVALALNARSGHALRGRVEETLDKHASALKEVLEDSPYLLEDLLDGIDKPRELERLGEPAYQVNPLDNYNVQWQNDKRDSLLGPLVELRYAPRKSYPPSTATNQPIIILSKGEKSLERERAAREKLQLEKLDDTVEHEKEAKREGLLSASKVFVEAAKARYARPEAAVTLSEESDYNWESPQYILEAKQFGQANPITKAMSKNPDAYQWDSNPKREALNVYFDKATGKRYVRQAALMDLEPGAMDSVKARPFGQISRHDNFGFGETGCWEYLGRDLALYRCDSKENLNELGDNY